MIASPSVIRAAELRRLAFLAEAERERQIDAVLAVTRANCPVSEAQAKRPAVSLTTLLPALVSSIQERRAQVTAAIGW